MDRLISEQAVFNLLKKTYLEVANMDLKTNSIGDTKPMASSKFREIMCRKIKAIPTAEPRYYPPCEDCHKKMNEIRKAYDKIQSAEPKTGYWIRVTDKTGHLVWKCDKCSWQQRFNTNFCPDCGAKMVEPQESEG